MKTNESVVNVGLNVGTFQKFQLLIPSNQCVDYVRNRSLRLKLKVNQEVIKVYRNRHIIFDLFFASLLLYSVPIVTI